MPFKGKFHIIKTANDMSDDDNYAKACDMIDVRNLADYMAFNIYIANEDSIVQGNNWRMWRVMTAAVRLMSQTAGGA